VLAANLRFFVLGDFSDSFDVRSDGKGNSRVQGKRAVDHNSRTHPAGIRTGYCRRLSRQESAGRTLNGRPDGKINYEFRRPRTLIRSLCRVLPALRALGGSADKSGEALQYHSTGRRLLQCALSFACRGRPPHEGIISSCFRMKFLLRSFPRPFRRGSYASRLHLAAGRLY